MGLLDDLRKKSSELQDHERSEKIDQDRIELTYKEKISPCLKNIYQQLRELTQYLQQDLEVDYVINCEGLRGVFQQQDYKLEIDSTERTKQITFRFKCLGPDAIKYHIADGEQLPKHLDFLNRYSLTYACKPHKNDRHQVTHADIDIKAYIPVTFVFQADIENSLIKLHVTNFECLGFQTYNLYLDQFTDQFYENIIRYIIREQVDFLKLNITDDQKKDIKQKLSEEMKQRQAELNSAITESKKLESEQTTGIFKYLRKTSS